MACPHIGCPAFHLDRAFAYSRPLPSGCSRLVRRSCRTLTKRRHRRSAGGTPDGGGITSVIVVDRCRLSRGLAGPRRNDGDMRQQSGAGIQLGCPPQPQPPKGDCAPGLGDVETWRLAAKITPRRRVGGHWRKHPAHEIARPATTRGGWRPPNHAR